MVNNNDLVITAGLDINSSETQILKDLKTISENLGNKAFKITCSVDVEETKKVIQSQLSAIGKSINISVPKIDITTGQNINTQNIAKSFENTNNKALTLKKTLTDLDDKYTKPFKAVIDTEGYINAERTLSKIQGRLSELGTVTVLGKYGDSNTPDSLEKISATIQATSGEVRTLNFLLDETDDKFKLFDSSFSDKGVAKVQKDITRLNKELANSEKTYESIKTGLVEPFKEAHNALIDLEAGIGSVSDVEKALDNLNKEAATIGKNLGAADKSFNIYDNATSKAKNFDNSIKTLKIGIEALGSSSKKTDLSKQIDDAEKKLIQLKNTEKQFGTGIQWSEEYKGLNVLLKEITSNIQLAKKIESQDSSSATQKQVDAVKELKQAYASLERYTKVVNNPNTSKEEKATAQGYILNYNKRINAIKEGLKQEKLYTQEIREQIKEFQKSLTEETNVAKSKAKGINARKEENAQIQNQNRLLDEIQKSYKQINSYEQKRLTSGNNEGNIYTREIENLQEKIKLLKDELSTQDLLNKEVEESIEGYERDLQLAREIRNVKANEADEKQADKYITLKNRIEKTSNALEDWANKNSKVKRSNKEIADSLNENTGKTYTYAEKLRELQDALNDLKNKNTEEFTEEDVAKFKHLNEEIATLKKGADAAGLTINAFFRNMRTQLSYVIMQWISLQGAIRIIKSLATEVVAVDTAMTELKKVTKATDGEFKRFANSAGQTAKELGASISDVINATSTFSRLGYSLPDAEELGRVATIFKNVGDGITEEEAAEALVSAMKAFKIEAKDSISIVDKFNNVGNNFAISSGGIGEALKRSSSALAAANNDISQSIALITTANTIAQDPTTVGQGIKTVSLRIRSTKTELEEMGEDTEGAAESVSKLREQMLALTGVDIQLDDNTYKSTYQILLEISKVWDKLTDLNRASVLEQLFGKRQSNIGAAILENGELLEQVYVSAEDSVGSAMAEQEEYAKSIQKSLDSLKASFQDLARTFIDSDLFKGLVDGASKLLNIVNTVARIIGTFPTLITGISIALSLVKGVGKPYKPNMPKLVLLHINVRSDTPQSRAFQMLGLRVADTQPKAV